MLYGGAATLCVVLCLYLLQSLVFAVGLFVVYEVYTSNGGELLREYLSQVVTLVIIAFLLWRVETLQELRDEA